MDADAFAAPFLSQGYEIKTLGNEKVLFKGGHYVFWPSAPVLRKLEAIVSVPGGYVDDLDDGPIFAKPVRNISQMGSVERKGSMLRSKEEEFSEVAEWRPKRTDSKFHFDNADMLDTNASAPHLHNNPMENMWDENSINVEHLENGLSSWHLLPWQSVVGLLQGKDKSGLTTEDVAKRQEEYGRNELEGGKQVTFLVLLFRHVVDFLMILLLVASGVSFGVGEYVDGGVILAIAIANVLIGVFQEFRAEKTLEALKGVTASMAMALRNGVKVEIPAADLVPGDIVYLSADGSGSGVAADMRLIETVNLDIVETTLTGESRPMHKSPDALSGVGDERFYANMCYNGTTVSGGRGTAVVVRTGMSTELGKIAANVQKSGHKKTDLQRELHIVSVVLFCTGILFAIVVFAANSFHIEDPENVRFSLVYAIAMIVAIIPEELPLVLTLTMVLGVRRMTEINVIVRQMSALENLGRVTDICSDKTGTITQASMVLTRAWLPGGRQYVVSGLGFNPEGDIVPAEKADLLLNENENKPRDMADHYLTREEVMQHPRPEDAALAIMARICGQCNGSQLHFVDGYWTGLGQPTDVACRVFAVKMGMLPSDKLITEHPFDSTMKRMTVVVGEDDASRGVSVLCKGAVERILPLCTTEVDRMGNAVPIDDDRLGEIEEAVTRMASMGLRVLAFAARGYCVNEELHADQVVSRTDAEQGMTLIGLGGLQDPPRPGVSAAVAECRRGGINVRMLTGDHLATAVSIATDVNILQNDGENAIDAVSFDQKTEAELDEAIDLPRVVARCTPESKVSMVHALHRRGKVVAMTGDGVNDAPALNAANIGVAMGKSGSDVTRQVAHIVLSDDNFVSLVAGVREGRRIFLSIKKFVVHVLATNVGTVLLLMVGLAFRDSVGQVVYPQSALEILILNMYVLSLPLMGLVTEPPSYDVMLEPPRRSRYVLTRDVLSDIFVYGIWLGFCAIGCFTGTLYGIYGGDIGLGCNSGSSGPDCSSVKQSRGATFLAVSMMLIFSAYNNRDAFEPVWRNFRKRPFNKVMFICSIIVFCSVILFIYVPGLNTAVFHHSSVYAGWGTACAAFVLYMIGCTFWKFLKRNYIFPGLYINARNLLGEETDPLMLGNGEEEDSGQEMEAVK